MNPVKKGPQIAIGDCTYHLVFDFDAIAEAEDITGKALVAGLRPEYVEQPHISFVRAMFFASARSRHPQLTYEEAKKLINRSNWAKVWIQVLVAWMESAPEPEVAEAAANPKQDQR